jgi:hypothetical protein
MPWGVAVAAVVGAYGASRQARAGERGANAQERASQQATEEQRRQFDLTRQDMAPWLQAGTDALGRQQAFLSGDWSGFQNSPDYKWAVDQGFKGLDRGAAAGGNLYSGGMDADRISLGQGLATQNANNYWNRLAGLSQTGQVTANQLGGYGQNMANNVGGNLMNAANARASSYMNSANAWANYGNQLAGLAGQAGGMYGRG